MIRDTTLTPTVPARVAHLGPWAHAGVFGPAEILGVEVLTRSDETRDPLVQLGVAFALWAPGRGHVCIDLLSIRDVVRAEAAFDTLSGAGDNRAGVNRAGDEAVPVNEPDLFDELPWPATGEWLAALGASRLVRCVERGDQSPVFDEHPLVLNGSLLYTQRQWIDECCVATALRARAIAPAPDAVAAIALDLLDRLLPPSEDGEPNQQNLAVTAALSSRLAVIGGGPGTGKTHTVARLLAVLLADAAHRHTVLRIGLAAPTGKAAARLRDAIAGSAISLQHDGDRTIPGELAATLAGLPAVTVHRLLGPRGKSTRFTYNAGNPLPDDVVVIDEASMVSLPLMARLLEAVRPEARLVLVGDPDQLESIEVGAVLTDIVDASSDHASPLRARVIRLSRARRQRSGSPIGPLADAVRENRPDDVITMLRAGATEPETGHPLLTFIEHANPLSSVDAAGVRSIVVPAFAAAMESARHGDADTALAAFASVRVLCAHRRGPHGAENWNRAIETWLLGNPPRTRHYPGRALLLTRNDPRIGLANGDTGIVVADPDGLHAAFAVGLGVRRFSPARLDGDETAFALTIHRSQGSEYDTVVVVLPPATSALIGRELLYTAITRANRRLVVVGTQAAVVAAVQTPGRRVTGLAAALRQPV